jgi:ABC-2 type transport system permease protein
LVPVTLLPPWAQQVSNFLPFQWTFNFPIVALIGNLSPLQLGAGLAAQALWIVGGFLLVNVVWRFGVRRFSSVGN